MNLDGSLMWHQVVFSLDFEIHSPLQAPHKKKITLSNLYPIVTSCFVNLLPSKYRNSFGGIAVILIYIQVPVFVSVT